MNGWLIIFRYYTKHRYKRTENCIIAIKLLPIFTDKPDLWKSIQYIKEISVTDNMDLGQYLSDWKKLIPLDLHSDFDNIIEIFTHDNYGTHHNVSQKDFFK